MIPIEWLRMMIFGENEVEWLIKTIVDDHMQGLGLMSLFGDLFHITFKYRWRLYPLFSWVM